MMKAFTTGWITILAVIGCAQQPSKIMLGQYQRDSRTTLEYLARGVSRSMGFGASKARGITLANGFSLGGNDILYQGSILNPNLNGDTTDCLSRVQGIAARPENYVRMVAIFSRCLNRVLVEGNPVMSYGYRNLDLMGQNYYAYLLNWRRFNSLENFSQNDFQLLSQFAGNGFYPGGNVTFVFGPR